jgi:hypothetical protein
MWVAVLKSLGSTDVTCIHLFVSSVIIEHFQIGKGEVLGTRTVNKIIFMLKLRTDQTEGRGRVRSIPASFSGGLGLKSWAKKSVSLSMC